jgi:hypothetical protein
VPEPALSLSKCGYFFFHEVKIKSRRVFNFLKATIHLRLHLTSTLTLSVL